MKLVISGGTGFIGRTLLTELVKKKHNIIVLTKHPSGFRHLENEYLKFERWDRRTLDSWAEYINNADAVINLAGEPISDIRWSKEQKEIIADSRIEATKALVGAIEKVNEKPTTLINASAVGFYGHVPNEEVTENYPRGSSFLSDTCFRWEKTALEARDFGTRVVLLRIGVVLAKDGGALRKMVPPFEMYAGGYPGDGKQWFPWVHRDDVIGAIIYTLENKNISGPVNVVSPGIVTMKDFCTKLAKILDKPCWGSIPAFVLKIVMGEMASMVLTGQKAIPKVLLTSGYEFKHKDAGEALESILS